MAVTSYWTGSLFVAEWTMVDPEGQPVSGATVTGVVSLPDSGTAAMSVSSTANVYTARYKPVAAGRHGWKLTAIGTAEGAESGDFVAQRDAVGLPPITVDPTTDIGMMRLYAADLSEIEPLLEDAHYTALLAVEGGSKKRAAAAALGAIAASEVLVSKKIRTLDLQTDGPAVAAELRAAAKALRDQAASEGDGPASSALLPLYSFPAAPAWADLDL